ncbi:MAG: reverse transcriptase domain-containing protein [Flavipsychrobacter sp.]
MKRLNNLYHRIYDIANLELADTIARRGKANQRGIHEHDQNKDMNLLALQNMLMDKTFTTSAYNTFTIYEPKERLIFRLPYYPDRILHHAVMNILELIFINTYTADTYSCIKGRGILKASLNLRHAMKDIAGTRYCLKLDITKFYPSVDHDILKAQLRRKFKDTDLLWLLDDIIDSAEGLPIGNYLSQFLANFYLTGFDQWLKQEQMVKYYFRYADDSVILSDNKPFLHQLLSDIKQYLQQHLKLSVKHNYQVFPVASRGIDFVGYKHYHGYTRLRKSIKQNCARKLSGSNCSPQTKASYRGWLKHCNARHLAKKLQLNQ